MEMMSAAQNGVTEGVQVAMLDVNTGQRGAHLARALLLGVKVKASPSHLGEVVKEEVARMMESAKQAVEETASCVLPHAEAAVQGAVHAALLKGELWAQEQLRMQAVQKGGVARGGNGSGSGDRGGGGMVEAEVVVGPQTVEFVDTEETEEASEMLVLDEEGERQSADGGGRMQPIGRDLSNPTASKGPARSIRTHTRNLGSVGRRPAPEMLMSRPMNSGRCKDGCTAPVMQMRRHGGLSTHCAQPQLRT